jgi:hypothetical protein
MRTWLLSPLLRWASRLRFPTLFWLVAALFVVDFAIPDIIPFADEILLGLATLLLGNWKRRRQPTEGGPPAGNPPPPPR